MPLFRAQRHTSFFPSVQQLFFAADICYFLQTSSAAGKQSVSAKFVCCHLPLPPEKKAAAKPIFSFPRRGMSVARRTMRSVQFCCDRRDTAVQAALWAECGQQTNWLLSLYHSHTKFSLKTGKNYIFPHFISAPFYLVVHTKYAQKKPDSEESRFFPFTLFFLAYLSLHKTVLNPHLHLR